ncbi:hypothetical protein I3I95_03390 [bacterium]|nr:hypothetical protein [bacterium]
MAGCGCNEIDEGTHLSDEAVARVRELLDPATKAGRVCLRMLDRGETIGEACGAEGADTREVMAEWHRLTDAGDIRCEDGRRPCISTLADAWKRRWEAQDAPAWMPLDASFAPGPFAGGPFAR